MRRRPVTTIEDGQDRHARCNRLSGRRTVPWHTRAFHRLPALTSAAPLRPAAGKVTGWIGMVLFAVYRLGAPAGAPDVELACVVAALTGAGYALAFQGFGLEAVRRAPPEPRRGDGRLRGVPGFLDGAGRAAGGWLALHAGLGSVYLAERQGRSAAALAVEMAR